MSGSTLPKQMRTRWSKAPGPHRDKHGGTTDLLIGAVALWREPALGPLLVYRDSPCVVADLYTSASPHGYLARGAAGSAWLRCTIAHVVQRWGRCYVLQGIYLSVCKRIL